MVKGKTLYQVDPRPFSVREHFSLLTKAKTCAEQFARERKDLGVQAVRMSMRERVELMEARDRLKPHGRTIREAVEHYVDHLEREKALQSALGLPDALRAWEASYNGRNRSRRTISEVQSMAKIFRTILGGYKLPEVTSTVVHSFLSSYRIEGDRVPSVQTLKNLCTKLSQFFEYARRKGWMTTNPCELVKQEGTERDIHILSVQAVGDLLVKAQESPYSQFVVPFLAISLFAGLRPGEVEQLEWQHIHFDTEELDVLPATSKTKKLRHVRMEPALIDWLLPWRQRQGLLVGSNWRPKWEAVRVSAGYKIGMPPAEGWPKHARKWPEDVLRHTFASYWLPIHKSKSTLSQLMGNSEAVVDRHYRKTIRESDAKAFWLLRPAGAQGDVIQFEALA